MTADEYRKSIKKKRESLGLSQKSFGKAANICKQRIYELEAGRQKPTLNTQLRLRKVYGITPMNEVKNNTIAYRVKTKRIEMGLTQNELANKIGVNRNTISRIEQGKEIPHVFTLVKMAVALKTTPDYFICMEDNGDAGSNS